MKASLSRYVAEIAKLDQSILSRWQTPDAVKRSGESEIDDLQWVSEYAEPGYTQPQKGILFANWNYFHCGIDTLLENYGFAIEWNDEWSTCEECNRAVRTSACL